MSSVRKLRAPLVDECVTEIGRGIMKLTDAPDKHSMSDKQYALYIKLHNAFYTFSMSLLNHHTDTKE